MRSGGFGFALYILLFLQLIAGPIIRWRDIAAQIPRVNTVSPTSLTACGGSSSASAAVLIANTPGHVADQLFALPASEMTPLAWLGLTCYTLQIYFDFSGYSDMAIGLMRMFGFRILENFNYPYISQSIREFWRRWHISLSNWFRDYLYIPLGGNQRGRARGYANLVIVFLLCGLWHGASWPFVVWGIWHGLFLVAERAGLDTLLARLGPLRHLYALAAVMGGWVLFRCETFTHALDYYAALFGGAAGDALRRPLASYLDPLVAITLLIAVSGYTGCAPHRRGAMRVRPMAAQPPPRSRRGHGVVGARRQSPPVRGSPQALTIRSSTFALIRSDQSRTMTPAPASAGSAGTSVAAAHAPASMRPGCCGVVLRVHASRWPAHGWIAISK